MSKNEYTDDFLLEKLNEYYIRYKEVPSRRNFDKIPEYPNSKTIINRFGSYKNALKLAGLLDKREDKSMFDRNEYSKDEVLHLLNEYIKKNGVVSGLQVKADKNMPSDNVFCKLFGSFNNAVKELGYKPLNEYRESKTDEDLIEILRSIYNNLKREITSRDIKNYGMSANTYITRFGNLYNAYDIAGIPYKKRLGFVSTEEIVQYWYRLKEKIGHIPTIDEIKNSDWDISNAFSTKSKRWKSYSDFLHSIGEDTNYNRYGCKPKFSKKGTKCLSVCELKITDWLEDNNICFEKEVPYKTIMPDDNTNRAFDWVINHNGQQYCVEMFGINGNGTYDEHKRQKIKDCYEHDIKLIKLNSNDAKKDLNKVFSFLFKNNDSNNLTSNAS